MAGFFRRNAALLWLAAPVAILLLVAAGLALKVLLEDLPEVLTRESLEARFSAQMALMERLASGYPGPECSADPVTLDPGSFSAWERIVEEHQEALSPPEILGASLVCTLRGGTTIRRHLKAWDDEGLAVSRSVLLPGGEWPRISLWYTSRGRVALYEARVARRDDLEMGYELALDVERLEREGPEGVRGSPPARSP